VPGLLIVNADDFGYDERSTDAAAECFARGGITSVSAMVYMRDSERAAAIAREAGVPVGLHLNLSEPYTGSDVAEGARRRQARLAERFSGRWLRVRRWVYDPMIRRDVDGCIGEQLERFQALYGAAPSHVDGHKHVQVSPNVLLSRAVRPGTRMRTALQLDATLLRPGRAARRRLMEKRFTSTDWCFDFAERERALQLARESTVELVVHPALRDYAALMSNDWARALERVSLGSFADL
jgi:chitin disaccharide deacetylase